jgi:hypothetical protein
VAGSRMAVSALVSWAASRSAAGVVAGADPGRVVVGTLGTAGAVFAIVVAALWGATGGGLTVDRPWPEHAATSRPAAKSATSRWTPRWLGPRRAHLDQSAVADSKRAGGGRRACRSSTGGRGQAAGDDPVIVPLLGEGGARVEIATAGDDRGRALGPLVTPARPPLPRDCASRRHNPLDRADPGRGRPGSARLVGLLASADTPAS